VPWPDPCRWPLRFCSLSAVRVVRRHRIRDLDTSTRLRFNDCCATVPYGSHLTSRNHSSASTTTIRNAANTTTTVASSTPYIAEPYEFGVPEPSEGAILGVVGVRHGDALNVRAGPDVTFDVIATLEPNQRGITGTGEGWQLPSGSVWWNVEGNGIDGWANQQFLSRLGDVDHMAAFVVGDLGGIPNAETMVGLGLIVASTFTEADIGSNVVVSVEPTIGDLGEVTYDVAGLGDDSVGGYRLHIFGPADGQRWRVLVGGSGGHHNVLRGVSAGRCV